MPLSSRPLPIYYDPVAVQGRGPMSIASHQLQTPTCPDGWIATYYYFAGLRPALPRQSVDRPSSCSLNAAREKPRHRNNGHPHDSREQASARPRGRRAATHNMLCALNESFGPAIGFPVTTIPTAGREDGDDSTSAWLMSRNRPYEELTAALTSSNGRGAGPRGRIAGAASIRSSHLYRSAIPDPSSRYRIPRTASLNRLAEAGAPVAATCRTPLKSINKPAPGRDWPSASLSELEIRKVSPSQNHRPGLLLTLGLPRPIGRFPSAGGSSVSRTAT